MLLVLSTLPSLFKHVSSRCCCGGGYKVPFVRQYIFTCLNHEWLHWEQNSTSPSLLVPVSLAITLCNHSAFFSVGSVALLICQWSETRAQAVAHCPRRGQASPWCHSILLQRSAILVKLTETQEERAKLTKQFDKNQLRNLTICQPSQRCIEQIVLSFISYIRQCFIFTLVKGFALAL